MYKRQIGVGNLQSATCIVGGTHATEYYGVLGCFRFCAEVLESLESGTFPYDCLLYTSRCV